jgi:hypothetical protein
MKLICFFLSAGIALCCPGFLNARSLPDRFIRSTVFIHNKSAGATGTGFLVKRIVDKDRRWKLVLISNKHVLMPKAVPAKTPDKTAEATLSLNFNTESGIYRKDIVVRLRTKDGVVLVKPHSKENVDVAGLVLPPEIVFSRENTADGSVLNPISEDHIMTKDMIRENFITIGDTAIILGYPLNLVEAGHVVPVARGAVFATSPRENFRGAPVFLVDSTIVRGSSGSPVFLPVAASKWIEEMKVNTFEVQQSYVVGIVSSTIRDWELVIKKEVMFGAPPQEITVLDAANLGIAFNGDCIIDVLNELNIPKWEETKDPEKSQIFEESVSNKSIEDDKK